MSPDKRGPGRQTTLTLTRLISLYNVISAGNFINTATKFVGVGETSFHKWRARGERELDRIASLPGVELDDIIESFDGKDPETLDKEGEPMSRNSPEWMWNHRPEEFDDPTEWPFVVFAIQMEKARAAAEVRILHVIHSQAAKDWKAGAWWLERTMPEKYGRVDRLKLTGDKNGEPVKVETTVTVDMVDAALEAMIGDDDDGQH